MLRVSLVSLTYDVILVSIGISKKLSYVNSKLTQTKSESKRTFS